MKTNSNTWKNTSNNFFQELAPWTLAIRIKTLPAGLSPVLLALGFTIGQGEKINGTIAILTLITTLLLQISSNLINDYYDGVKGIDDESRLGPTRVTQAKLISPSKVKRGYLFTTFVSFLIGIYLSVVGGFPIFITGIISIIFCYLYTAGPKPLSHLGLGELLALIFFGIVAFNGTYFLQTNHITMDSLILSLTPGLLSATILSINNVRDRENDLSKNKITLAVILGKEKSRLLPITLLLLSFTPLIYFSLLRESILFLIPILLSFLFKSTWKGILNNKISTEFNLFLANTGKYLFLTSVLLSLIFIFLRK